MCWPAIRYAKKHGVPFTNYVLDLWPENLYSVLPVKNGALRAIAQGGERTGCTNAATG